jgi:hypothetical protein
MANKILTDSTYYDSVRRRLGVTTTVVSNDDIDDEMILGLAEIEVIRLVPDYLSIEDESDLLYLRSSVITYIAYLLCPLCAAKSKIEVKTIDTSWKKDKVDWEQLCENLYSDFLKYLNKITTLSVNLNSDSTIFAIAKSARKKVLK